VYVVMTPQTHLTIVSDDETYIEGVFTNLEPTIATAIQNAQNGGKNVTAAQAAFTDLKSQVAAAQAETTGQSASLLAQTPTGYPGNWQVFLAARTNATNAHTDLRAAYADAEKNKTDLQLGRGSPPRDPGEHRTRGPRPGLCAGRGTGLWVGEQVGFGRHDRTRCRVQGLRRARDGARAARRPKLSCHRMGLRALRGHQSHLGGARHAGIGRGALG